MPSDFVSAALDYNSRPRPQEPSTVTTTYGYALGPPEGQRHVHDPFGLDRFQRLLAWDHTSKWREAAEARWHEAHAKAKGRPVKSMAAPHLDGGAALLADWEVAAAEHKAREAEATKRGLAALAERRKEERRRDLLRWVTGKGVPRIHAKAYFMGRGTWKPETEYAEGQRVTRGPEIYLCIESGRSGKAFPSTKGDPLQIKDGGTLWQRMRAQEEAARCLRQWEKNPEDRKEYFLALLGAPGTCKTGGAVVAYMEYALECCADEDAATLNAEHLVMASKGITAPAHDAFRGAPRVVYWHAGAMWRANVFGKEATEEIERGIKATVLILDDLGAEYVNEKSAWMPVLDHVMNRRYEEGRITILTANVDPQHFAERVGARIADRFREAGRLIPCGNLSVRRALQKAASPTLPDVDQAPTSEGDFWESPAQHRESGNLTGEDN